MTTNIPSICLFFFLLVFVSGQEVSVYNTSTICTNGCDFFDPLVWINNSVPTNGSIVVINGGHSVLYINSTLVISQWNQTGPDSSVALHVGNSLTITGSMFVNTSGLKLYSSEPRNRNLIYFNYLSLDSRSLFKLYAAITIGVGVINASDFSQNSILDFYCGDCYFDSFDNTLTNITAINVTVAENSIFYFNRITAVNLVLLPSAFVQIALWITITGSTFIDNNANLWVAQAYNMNGSFSNIDSNSNPPLMGNGQLTVGSTKFSLIDYRPEPTPFNGQIQFWSGSTCYLQNLILNDIILSENIATYFNHIKAVGVTFGKFTGNMYGPLFASPLTPGGLSLQINNNFTTTLISVTGGQFILPPGSNVHTSSPLSLNETTFITTNATINSVTLFGGKWESEDTNVFGNVTLSGGAALQLSPNSTLTVYGILNQTSNSTLIFPLLSNTSNPLVASNASVHGALNYSLQETPKQTTNYTVLKTNFTIQGNFSGEPNPINSNEVQLHFVYNPNSIQLEYVHKNENIHHKKSLWWISILVIIFILFLLGFSAFFYLKHKRSKVGYTKVNDSDIQQQY